MGILMSIPLIHFSYSALRICIVAAMLALHPPWATASSDPVTAEPYLVVTLDADLPGGPAELWLGFSALSELPVTDYLTSTVWTDGVASFSGVLLWDLLLHIGIDPVTWQGSMTFHAIDGYLARIESEVVTQQAPILALLKNGQPMARRRHGPFWVVFPYDADPAFRTETIFSLSVWQVERLSVAP